MGSLHPQIPGSRWGVLGSCWGVLHIPRSHWGVLHIPGPYWGVLHIPGPCWGVLHIPGSHWGVLHIPGSCRCLWLCLPPGASSCSLLAVGGRAGGRLLLVTLVMEDIPLPLLIVLHTLGCSHGLAVCTRMQTTNSQLVKTTQSEITSIRSWNTNCLQFWKTFCLACLIAFPFLWLP